MIVKRNNENSNLDSFLGKLRPSFLRPGPTASAAAAFLISLFFITNGPLSDPKLAGELREFEVGRVSDRDVVAERSISYVDEEATQLRREAEERLVPAVFRFSDTASRDSIAFYRRFASLARSLFTKNSSAEAFKLAMQAEFPGLFSKDTLDALFRSPSRLKFLDYGESVLKITLDGGVFSLPKSGLDVYNPDTVELVRKNEGRIERERIPYSKVVTLQSVRDRLGEVSKGGAYPTSFANLAQGLLMPFISENVFFSSDDTAQRLAESRSRVEPVVKQIERGDRVIKKGFIVSKDDMIRLRALGLSLTKSDPAHVTGQILVLLFVFGFFIYLLNPRVIGRLLKPTEVYLLSGLTAAYLVGAVFASRVIVSFDFFPSAIFLPTALVVMLPAVLMGPRVALAVAVSLPLAAFVSGAFDPSSFIFALGSGMVGAYILQGAERRMDLVKAGFLIALANSFTALGVLLLARSSWQDFPPTIFWAAFNGLSCGMFVLGFLPPLEQALNATTTFRLIELSDLNSPMLKRLLTSAPGTYSHSVTVANLAESACREIGANVLIARVGAYYHDIGKMDQPDYFIENQAAYNKHEEIAPRLSATVIRSHVKLGIEKARRMGLPKEIVDIIAEHHGNSVISWFYNAALKKEDQVNAEDFAYPGSPPRTKESAVVMLADTVEAAVRTLKKPTMTRLEKFVQELIMSKFEQGQLTESDLTFRDLETIKNAFVRVLAGHYHSRIEYPKSPKELPL